MKAKRTEKVNCFLQNVARTDCFFNTKIVLPTSKVDDKKKYIRGDGSHAKQAVILSSETSACGKVELLALQENGATRTELLSLTKVAISHLRRIAKEKSDVCTVEFTPTRVKIIRK
jgi:hypothetical protein